jgi:hypothetical protein
MGRTKNTVYLEDYQRAFFELAEEIKMTGAVRRGVDLWLDEQDVPASELEMATGIVANSDRELETVLAECEDVDEFIEKAKASIESGNKASQP